MSEVRTVKCDVCGRQKQETNHWLIAIQHPDLSGILFVPADDAQEDLDYPRQDICGRACATQRLNQWIESITATPGERQPA